MTAFKNILFAGAIALGTTTAAQAATSGSGVMFTPNVDDAFTFTFNWDSAPIILETGLFGIAFDFDLTILDYSGTGDDLTGYFIDDAAGNRLTDSVSDCVTNGSIVGDCNLVSGQIISGFTSDLPGDVVLTGLSAGEYNFSIFESGSPVPGSVTFGVSKVSAVPLPAGGLLLLGALGGIAAVRRRRKS